MRNSFSNLVLVTRTTTTRTTTLAVISFLFIVLSVVVVDATDARVRQGRIGGPSTRIINGQDARQGRFPWFVRLVGDSQCGGALISRDLVLTAAHCEGGFRRAEIGKQDLSNFQEGNPGRPVLSTHPHPDWTGVIPHFDIMIVKLQSAVPERWLPVKLNFDESVPSQTGEPLRMIGFGSVTPPEDGLLGATILQEAPTAYMAFEDCAVASNPETGGSFGSSVTDTEVEDDWFCTILNTPERFAHCFGDSGGPIFIEGESATEDVLVATISGAQGGCGNRFLPDINQRVAFHQDWIREVGCDLSDFPPSEWNCDGGDNNGPATPTPVSNDTPQPTPAPVVTLPPNSDNESPDNIPAEPEPDDNNNDNNNNLPDGIVSVYVIINFDISPREIAWFISDEDYSEFRVGAPWGAYQPNRERAEELVYLHEGGRYQFTIEDLNGNGLSEGGGGDYSVVLGGIDGPVLLEGGGDFGEIETKFFSIPVTNGYK